MANIGDSQTFNYTGAEQTWVCPEDGLYKWELEGGQGGTWNGATTNKGGKTTLYAVCSKGAIYYVNVGGKGNIAKNGQANGGYNGGGRASSASMQQYGDYVQNGSGGGATHVAKRSGLLSTLASYLSDILGVAGGSGGTGMNYYGGVNTGGTGGGLEGGNGTYGGNGGTQSTGFAFGLGESKNSGDGTGGGGGLYGGYSDSNYGAGGGSGYIFALTTTFKGTTYNNVTENGIREGNGLAKVTYIAKGFPTSFLGNGQIVDGFFGNTQVIDGFIGNVHQA